MDNTKKRPTSITVEFGIETDEPYPKPDTKIRVKANTDGHQFDLVEDHERLKAEVHDQVYEQLRAFDRLLSAAVQIERQRREPDPEPDPEPEKPEAIGSPVAAVPDPEPEAVQ
jgi:hypothetical protein